jgi:DNA-directed RNA polymerase specialized sigma24 family protein
MNRERAETFLRLVAEAELRQLTTDPRDSAPLPDVPGAEREAAGLLRRPAVVAMLRALDDRQREAITLQYHAGLSEAETAATMRISRSGTWTTPPCPATSHKHADAC